MKLLVKQGATSKLARIFVQDSSKTTGAGLAGLTSSSSGLTWYYCREGDTSSTSVTLAAGTLGTWSSGGFVAVDGTNMPGVYEIGLPNAALSSGQSVVMVLQGAANMAPLVLEIQLVAFDPNNANLGLSNVSANVAQWNGTNVAVPATAGIPDVNAKNIAGQAAVLDANNFLKVDLEDIHGVAVNSASAQLGVNVVQWATSAVSVDTNSLPNVNAKAINAVLTTPVTTINANVGSIQPFNFTGTGASALVQNDTRDFLGHAITLDGNNLPAVNAADIGGQSVALDSSHKLQVDVVKWNGSVLAGTLPPDQIFLRVGTAQGGGASTITLDSGASATNNFYQNAIVFLYGGTGAGQCALITTYVGSTKVATINGTWATNPDATSTFALLPFGAISANVSGNVTVGGYAAGEDPATLVLGATASSWNTAGTIGAKINAASAPTAAQVATAVWQDTTAGDFTVVGSIGKLLNTFQFDGSGFVKSDPQTAVTVSGTVAANVTEWLGVAVTADAQNLPNVNVKDYNGTVVSAQPYTGTPPTTAQITTAIFTDLTSGSDFTTAGSIGKLLTTNLDTNVGSRMATFTLPANFSSLAISGGGAVTVGTNNDKSGYSLTQTFPANFSSLLISASGNVTVGTNNDKTGYSLTQAFPANFASLSIDTSGRVTLAPAGVDAVVIETGLNLRQATSIIAAASAGVLSGAATTTVTIEGAGVATTRVVATVDSSGDRSAVTLTPPT